MKNLAPVDEPADVPTKTYADDKIVVGTADPTSNPATEIWIDTN